MPIKAKRVNPERAAQVARGQLSTSHESGKNYFYYEQVKKGEMRERDGDGTSSSSNESSRAGSPMPPLSVATGTSSSSPVVKSAGGATDEAESDDELVTAARERTRRFLYPESEKNYVSPPYHNARAEAYACFREAQQRRASAPVSATSATRDSPGLANYVRETISEGGPDDAELPRASSMVNVTPTASRPAQDPTAQDDAPGDAHQRAALPEPQIYEASSASDPRRAEFYKLLNLIGEDVKREWSGRAAAGVVTETATVPPPPAAASTAPVAASRTRTYRPPAHNFADLQDDALQQLYEEWTADHVGDDDSVFVAADHAAEAFTRAAALSAARAGTRDLFRAADGGPTRLSGAPLTIEELASHSTAGSAFSIASEAQGQLDRFLASVGWIERLVRDPRFIASTASFLHTHHKPFMRYLAPTADPTSSLTEHDHQEFSTYEEFGSQFSDLLLRLLTEKVKDFDEAEFVEALYETPVTARTQFAAATAARDSASWDNQSARDASREAAGPQNVLSYPAWRIILAMSSFESFFDWMIDYVREEYNVSPLDEEEHVVAVGGARGVRALIRSTYGDGASAAAASADLAQAGATVGPHSDARDDVHSGRDSAFFGDASAALTSSSSLSAPARLSPSPPPPTALQPLSRPDSSPPFASGTDAGGAASSVPPTSPVPSRFFPTPPASADGRLKQSSQKPRLGQRLPPLTAKNMSHTLPASSIAATASATVPVRTKSGTKRSVSQTKRQVSSAGTAEPTTGSRRSSAVGSAAGSASTSPHKTKAGRSASKQRGPTARTTARSTSKTKLSGGTKPKLKRTGTQ